MNIDKMLSNIEFHNREYGFSHLPYEYENAFFKSIKDGNTEEVLRLFKPFSGNNMGKLSDDSLRNLKYHLIITVAFITRSCIEGGMEPESAYNLSDIYIRNIDKCRTDDEVNMLHREIVNDYAWRMYMIHRTNQYSKPVAICIDYIYNNLHTRITLDTLVDVTGLSKSYLSRTFHKEVGTPFVQYVIQKRIEAAEKMLCYSELSCLEITEYLCFSSESHFIQVFRRYTGYTPKKYRMKFYRVRS